ncbi:hypothetical protein [Actinoplanes xinjiangensis]|uniref:hypothetical protein n=1 Tax=Actinoplanes xinjiangensis TaxID=512350 RepID=UPI00341B6261
MARKPPAHVRATLPRRREPGVRIALVDGVSTKGLARIAHLERTRLGPGAAAAALKSWQEFARASTDERADRLYYGHAGCCPDPLADRATLERVLRVLPPSDAKALRHRIEALDDRIGTLDD